LGEEAGDCFGDAVVFEPEFFDVFERIGSRACLFEDLFCSASVRLTTYPGGVATCPEASDKCDRKFVLSLLSTDNVSLLKTKTNTFDSL
jgi:hypothetical protein